MSPFEHTLQLALRLSPEERHRLAVQLLDEDDGSGTDSENAVGQRGLKAWTESARDEDWSAYYPQHL